MAVDLSANFDRFLSNICLGDPQVPRMNSAADAVSAFLVTSSGLSEGDVFLQGSYANHTAIEPVNGGEYDIDIAAVCTGQGVSADSALNDLEARFRADGRYRDRVNRKNPCVRLEYAEDDVGKFHVDVVPVRPCQAPTAPLEAPRRGQGWHETAPAEYTAWCTQQGVQYVRTVRMMKRWRDEQQSVRAAIKSIVLQVLVAECMPKMGDDAYRLSETFRQLQVKLVSLQNPPVIPNPVLPGENLAARWTVESFQSFQPELTEAIEWADKAMNASDVVEAADAWRELLGDDFPVIEPAALGFRVGDHSHAQSPTDMGWTEQLDPRYSARVTAWVQRGKRGQTRRPYADNGSLVFAGHRLRFRADVTAPNHVGVWWQVANTGAHARERSGLRGEIFKARDMRQNPSADPMENWEDSSYTGSHLIRVLLVRDRTVVASSPWFRVNIYSTGRGFRL